MRVLHVINTLGGSGGAENGLVREITRFDPDVDQLVLRLFARNDLEPVVTDHGIEVAALGLDGSAASRNWPLAAKRVRTWIRRFAPDVVHTSLFSANLVGQIAARSVRAPVLSTFTQSGDVELVRSYQPGASSRTAAALRSIADRAARSPLVRFRALTADAAATNLAVLRVPDDRVRIIPRGVVTDLPPPDPAVREAAGVPPDAPLVINVGRQAAQKGHQHLIRAFELVAQRIPDAHLVILGREGDASSQLRTQLASSPVADRVHLLGFRKDAGSIVGTADVFMFSSLMEGLGTAVLEAMAARVPIVSFDIPPVREITDQGRVAHLVPVGSVEGLAADAVAILTGKEPGRAEAAYEWTRQRYDIGRVASQLQGYLAAVANLR
jgi:glycosyltransferase involved in cell wall biosynthesis